MTGLDDIVRGLSRSLCVRFGTDAPFAIGPVTAERVGYAAIPSVVVTVTCRPEDVSALVPVVRQRVFGELAERGWGDEHLVDIVPGVQAERRRRFVDGNEESLTCGRARMGVAHRFRWEMSREMARATFKSGSFASIPDRREPQR